MPKANNPPQLKPWYTNKNVWAWIIIGICIIAFIVATIANNVAAKRLQSDQHRPSSYEEIFTLEEARKMGIGRHIDGPGDWKPDPNTAQKARGFIQKGGNADPTLDAIQDGDYHDLLDQMGGTEGF